MKKLKLILLALVALMVSNSAWADDPTIGTVSRWTNKVESGSITVDANSTTLKWATTNVNDVKQLFLTEDAGSSKYYIRSVYNGRYVQGVNANSAWSTVTKSNRQGLYINSNGTYRTLTYTTSSSNNSGANAGANNTVLGYLWASGNGRSWWTVTNVSNTYNIYDIVVTGLADVSSVNVSTNGVTPVGATTLHNGEAFFFDSSVTPTNDNFTATAVAGYDYEVTVADGAVTVAYEVSTAPTQYTVVVTGDPTGTGGIVLTDGDVQKLNNETFEFTGVPALTTDYTVIPVSGYKSSQAISGTTITVTYYTDVKVGGRYYIKGYQDNGTGPRYIYASSSSTMATTLTKPTDGSDVWVVEANGTGTYKLKNELNGTYMNYNAALDASGVVTYINDDLTTAAGFIGKYAITVQSGSNYRLLCAGTNGTIGYGTKTSLAIAYSTWADNASWWRNMELEAVSPLTEITYTVVVTGAPEGQGGISLTTDATEVKNGGTFKFTGIPTVGTDFTVLEIENYLGTVSISDATVTVSYEDISAYAKTVSDITEGWYQIQVGEGDGANSYHSAARGRIMQGQSTTVTGANNEDWCMWLVDQADATDNSYIYVTNNEGVVTLRTLDGYFMQANGKRTTSSANITVTQPEGTSTTNFKFQGGGQYTCTWGWTKYGVGSTSNDSQAGTARWRFISVGDEVASNYDIYTVEWGNAEGTLTSSNGRVIFNNKVVLQEQGVDLTADGFSGSTIDGYDIPVVTVDVENKKIVVTYNEPTETTYYVHTTPENVGGAYLATATETVYANGESFGYIGTPVAGTNVLAQEVNGYTSVIEVVGTDVNVTYTSVREELLDMINMLKTNYADNNVGTIGYYSEEGRALLYTNVINPALEVYNDVNATTADIQSAKSQLTTVIMSGILISDSYIQKPTVGSLIKIQAPSGNYVLGNGERSSAAPIGAEDGTNAVWYYSNATTLIGYNNGIGISYGFYVAEPTEELTTFTFVCAGELGKLYVKTSYKTGSNNNYWKENGTSLARTTGTDKSQFVVTAVDNSDIGDLVPVEITAAKRATFASDKALDFTGLEVQASICDGTSDAGQVIMNPVNKVKAGTGLYVGAAEAGVYYVPVYTGDDYDDDFENALVANVTGSQQTIYQLAGEYTNYVLQKKSTDTNPRFYKVNESGNTVNNGRAYLQIRTTEPAAAKEVLDVDDVTTGIEEREEREVREVTGEFNLAGQRVGGDYKGIVIVNGKKTLVK